MTPTTELIPPTVEDLEKRLEQADSELRTATNLYHSKRTEMVYDAERKIKLFLDSIYGSEIDELNTRKWAADAALKSERERLALAGVNAPYPIGTKLQKDIGRRYDRKLVYGVVEAVTRETQWQDNLSRWNRPRIGAFVVRFLKTNGEPSVKIDTYIAGWEPVPGAK